MDGEDQTQQDQMPAEGDDAAQAVDPAADDTTAPAGPGMSDGEMPEEQKPEPADPNAPAV